ncbi:MAG: hypothetical protein WD206_10145 [Actinomycetota bacterium]
MRNAEGPLYAENVKLRVVAVGLAFFLAGVACAWVGEAWLEGVSSQTVSSVGTALFTLGLGTIAYEVWLRRSVTREMLAAHRLSIDLTRAGILEINSVRDVDWKDFVDSNAGDMTIVVPHARTWSAAHAQMVCELAATKNFKVTVCLLDPSAPKEILELYGHRTREYLAEVEEQWRRGEATARDRSGHALRIEVERLAAHTPHSFYRKGDVMWVVLHSRQRDHSRPAILCARTGHNDGLFDWVYAEWRACKARVAAQATSKGKES